MSEQAPVTGDGTFNEKWTVVKGKVTGSMKWKRKGFLDLSPPIMLTNRPPPILFTNTIPTNRPPPIIIITNQPPILSPTDGGGVIIFSPTPILSAR
jgi:hypothetical protein